MATDGPEFTWDSSSRRYRDARGRFVSRDSIRRSVDDVVDSAVADIRSLSLDLQAGRITVADWQARMERALKTAHVAVGAIGAGGRENAIPADWLRVARILKVQYAFLRDFAKEIENGLPLDGRFLARAAMYGVSATQSYEGVLRRGDLAAGYREERRTLHSEESCRECVEYAERGWQPAGELPDIGQDCACKSNCRCRFERRKGPRSRALGSEGVMTTAKLGYDSERCRRRNRVAALRDGVDAMPVRVRSFLAADSEAPEPVYSRGTLAGTPEQALKRINDLRPGRTPLTADDVHLLEMEAGNNRFVGDRFLFLGTSTLKNVASGAADGFAFMNSHRSGGLSHPAELPFGRTFAGRFERYRDEATGAVLERTILQIYMRKGIRPSGDQGPSTDDLASAIDAGTVFDVSLGLKFGTAICDVCQNPVNDGAKCPHVPGSDHAMSPDQVEKQAARGVPGGVASVTLVDSQPGEVSAVYDGAVPGAGFRKAVSLSRRGDLSEGDVRSVLRSLRGLADADDFRPKGRTPGRPKAMPRSYGDRIFGFFKKAQQAETTDDLRDLADEFEGEFSATPKPGGQSSRADDVDLATENARLKAQLAAREADDAAAKKKADDDADAAIGTAAKAFAVKATEGGKVIPTEKQKDVEKLHAQLARDDRQNPIEGFSRKEVLEGVYGAIPKAKFGAHVVATTKKEALKDDESLAPRGDEGAATNDEYEAGKKYASRA